mmetsp:Transcript_88381/g.249002  ORF Transcript_88381/g.249002 Transcript_88381/m.249002 type:complete len:319 (+) Transcript_88381:203-1159(+)
MLPGLSASLPRGEAASRNCAHRRHRVSCRSPSPFWHGRRHQRRQRWSRRRVFRRHGRCRRRPNPRRRSLDARRGPAVSSTQPVRSRGHPRGLRRHRHGGRRHRRRHRRQRRCPSAAKYATLALPHQRYPKRHRGHSGAKENLCLPRRWRPRFGHRPDGDLRRPKKCGRRPARISLRTRGSKRRPSGSFRPRAPTFHRRRRRHRRRTRPWSSSSCQEPRSSRRPQGWKPLEKPPALRSPPIHRANLRRRYLHRPNARSLTASAQRDPPAVARLQKCQPRPAPVASPPRRPNEALCAFRRRQQFGRQPRPRWGARIWLGR